MDDENKKTMILMNNSKSFDELLSIHQDWINGRIEGYSYQCFSTLDELDGDVDFIELLRYVTDKLSMVTIYSQSACKAL